MLEIGDKKISMFLFQDLIANENRITDINDHCEKLGQEEHPDIEEIKSKYQVRGFFLLLSLLFSSSSSFVVL